MTQDIYDIDLSKCTPQTRRVFTVTLENVEKYRMEFLTPEHLLFSIIIQDEFKQFCNDYLISQEKMRAELVSHIQDMDRVAEDEEYEVRLSVNLQFMLKIAKSYMYETNKDNDDEQDTPLDVADLIMMMYDLDNSMTQYLLMKYLGEHKAECLDRIRKYYEQDIEDYYDIASMTGDEMYDRMMASANRLMGALSALGQGFGVSDDDDDDEDEEDIMDSMEQSEPWEEYVTQLTPEVCAKKVVPLAREKELTRTVRILCRHDKNNPLFIGEPGVGKTTMIYGLIHLIASGQVPEWMKKAQIYSLDVGALMAGTSYHGEFEKRMKMILDGLKAKGNCILYIDDIHTLMDVGGNNGSLNAADLLMPYLEDGTIRFVGSTTYQDYNKTMANRKAIARRFGLIDIKEPSVEEAISMAQGALHRYESHHKVKYTEEALRYAVEQSHALITDRYLPDKAFDIIDEAGAYRQQNPLLKKDGTPKARTGQKVDVDVIRNILTEVCRIDSKALSSESNEQLKDLDKRISSDIYGQDEAVKQVVRAVMMAKAGLTEPDKPLASLLFVGPTGVGKTEVCKVLARELGVELLRFDMSEYTEKHTVSKLIGSPAGYVGYEEGGLLTDAIRRTPNCVLLLDEIEKAHSDIYNILLQVMDYAKLTDNKGNKADFKNVILIMTSNAGAQYASQASIGFAGGQSRGEAMLQTVKKTFKPEFLNRLSATVVFHDMDKKMASLILEKKLRHLSERLAAKHVTMTLTDEARQYLLKKGFTPQYGAREMDRTIQQELTPLLMDEILFGSLTKGGEISITLSPDNKLTKAPDSKPEKAPGSKKTKAPAEKAQKPQRPATKASSAGSKSVAK